MVGLLGAISDQEQQGLLDPMPRRQPVGLLGLLRAIPEAFGNAGRAGLEGYAQALAGFDNEGRTIGNVLPLAKDERTGEMSLASPRILDLWNTVGGVGGGATLGAGPVMRRGGDVLDMSQEARMARAREMGFVPSRKMYHGSGGDIEGGAFRAGTDGEMHIPGVSVTRDRMVAGYYAGDDGVIHKLLVRGKKSEYPDYLDWMEKNELWNVTPDKIMEAARKDGLKGFYFPENDEFRVFDPRNIRSTQAAFDPARADSADLLASRAAPGAAVPADRRRLNWRDAEDML